MCYIINQNYVSFNRMLATILMNTNNQPPLPSLPMLGGQKAWLPVERLASAWSASTMIAKAAARVATNFMLKEFLSEYSVFDSEESRNFWCLLIPTKRLIAAKSMYHTFYLHEKYRILILSISGRSPRWTLWQSGYQKNDIYNRILGGIDDINSV